MACGDPTKPPCPSRRIPKNPVELAKLLAKGTKGIARALLKIDPATDAEIERRRNICRDCPHATRNPRYAAVSRGLAKSSQCTLCTCLIVLKTMDRKEKCEDGRW